MITFTSKVGHVEHTARFCETRDDVEAFRDWARTKRWLSLDTESTGLDHLTNPDWRLRLVQVSDGKQAWMLSVESAGPAAWEAVKEALARCEHLAVFNAPFEAFSLTTAGLIDWDHFWAIHVDGRPMAHLLDSRGRRLGGCPLDLKSLSYKLVESWSDKAVRYRKDTEKADLLKAAKAARGKQVTKDTMWREIPINDMTYLRYSAQDALWTWKLIGKLHKLIRDHGFADLHRRERRFAKIVAEMIRRGFEVDQTYVRELEPVMAAEMTLMAAEIRERHGVANPNSPQQVLAGFHRVGIEPCDDTGKASTARAVLERLEDVPLAADMLAYRMEAKALTACVRPMLKHISPAGRLHPGFNPLGTVTARMSCSRPNLQQMPKRRGAAEKMRNCLRADEGKVIVAADLAAIEYRVAAGLSRDPFMLDAFARGIDLHAMTAEELFPGTGCSHKECDHRTFAKNAGFGKIYGAGAATIARQTYTTVDQAKIVIARYDETLSGLAKWSEDLVSNVNEEIWNHGEASVTTLHGRHVPVDIERSYCAVNYAIQSEARDVLVDWVFNADDAGLLDGMLSIIHDEIVCQADPGDADELAMGLELCASALNVAGVPVQADAKVGTRNWGSLYAKKPDVAPTDEERPDSGE